MTKQSSFKRAARERARATGQRYTQARADLELANRQAFIGSRPFEQTALKAHLERHYGIEIYSILPIDDDPATRPAGSWPGHYPSTLVVKHTDGQQWIARVFSSSTDRVSRVRGDAEVLQFLAANRFPAEQIAHQDPVTVLDGNGIIVTDLIDGGRPSAASPQVWSEMANLLGQLHSLPPAGGATTRDGGAEEHGDGSHVGRPKEQLPSLGSRRHTRQHLDRRLGRVGAWAQTARTGLAAAYRRRTQRLAERCSGHARLLPACPTHRRRTRPASVHPQHAATMAGMPRLPDGGRRWPRPLLERGLDAAFQSGVHSAIGRTGNEVGAKLAGSRPKAISAPGCLDLSQLGGTPDSSRRRDLQLGSTRA
ncbi:phosphotransferase [Microlunatus soli]|uniref:Aminoglycoside phosphotransferase domain-containing protein n=1 Tax=Microlunatus soli TaxID=630515 RepID=A0A1H1T4B8_9ACTN|nr:hypothetical protein SAMN04489812_2248 [Microlunatus soli]